jgi:hypothetical protein
MRMGARHLHRSTARLAGERILPSRHVTPTELLR